MKKLITVALGLCLILNIADAQQQLNMSLLSNWDDPAIPAAFYGPYNDCWGYVDSAGREYAIIGSSEGAYFFDVTDGSNPVMVSFQPSKDQSTLAIHRDYKTYQHYCYAVADEGQNSLQIFDLQYLPDSVVKVYDSNVLCKRAHNIFIEGDKLYLASNAVGNTFRAMDVLSLANPVSPTFISTLSNPNFSHVHDVFVKNDTAYCSVGYEGLYVYSYVNAASPQLLMSLTSYPEQGYNHSSWLSPDGIHIVMADENHGSGLKLVDISDFSNPVIKSVFRSNMLNISPPNGPNGSIPHNEFIRDNFLFVSYYHEGVQVFDISDPSNPVQFAWYDTYTGHTDYNSYIGCWGVYPFLPSGKIIASDMYNGLFILDGSVILGSNSPGSPMGSLSAFPNPFRNELQISIPSIEHGDVKVQLTDLSGRVIYSTTWHAGDPAQLTIPAYHISQGLYMIIADTNQGRFVSKVVRSAE